MTAPKNPTLAAALRYCARGWYVYPSPKKNGPAYVKWGTEATNNQETVKAWFQRWQKALVCIACGPSGLAVIDLDVKGDKNGPAVLKILESIHGKLPPTLTQTTASGGTHLIFAGTIKTTAGVLGPGIDTRGTGGMIVAAPSPGYTMHDDAEFGDVIEPAPLPQWLADLAGRISNAPDTDQDPAADLDASVNIEWAKYYLQHDAEPSTQGKDGAKALMRVAAKLKDHGISEGMAVELLAEFYNVEGKCDPLWTMEDSGPDSLPNKVRNAWLYMKETQPGADTPAADFGDEPEEDFAPTPESASATEAKKAWQAARGGFKVKDFLRFLPKNDSYIFIPTGSDAFWPGSSLNLKIKPVPAIDPQWKDCTDEEALSIGSVEDRFLRDSKGNVVMLSAVSQIAGLSQQHVAGETWWPGKSAVLNNVVVREGGVISKHGAHTFNRYRAPRIIIGAHPSVKRWLDHVIMLYPDDWQHIVRWLAHRVQHADQKIMHALVLGGPTRIGKDTLLKPVPYAIGPWNLKTTTAQYIMEEPKCNGYLEAVICLISEARDFGDENRFAFYERMKPWLGGVAGGVLSVVDKYIRQHPVIDVVGFIITTNFKVRGLYLPADDARHYIAWCNLTRADIGAKLGFKVSDDPLVKDELEEKYFVPLYQWYASGGFEAVAAYLATLDLSDFSPTAPPPKTAAWFEIVDAYADPKESRLAGVLEMLGNPPAVSVREVSEAADRSNVELEWSSGKGRNQVAADFEVAEYVHQRNPATAKGRWVVGPKERRNDVRIYVQAKLTPKERLAAAHEVFEREQKRATEPVADPIYKATKPKAKKARDDFEG
jgi:hypothetical protein